MWADLLIQQGTILEHFAETRVREERKPQTVGFQSACLQTENYSIGLHIAKHIYLYCPFTLTFLLQKQLNHSLIIRMIENALI